MGERIINVRSSSGIDLSSYDAGIYFFGSTTILVGKYYFSVYLK